MNGDQIIRELRDTHHATMQSLSQGYTAPERADRETLVACTVAIVQAIMNAPLR